MSSCGHSTQYYFLPPTLTFLQENFPTLTVDTTIDRSLLRCRLCDLIDTQTAANLAETGPPNLESEASIEKQIIELKQAIAQGIKQDTEYALPNLQKKLYLAVRATDERILEAWTVYWGVWGLGEGPDREDEGLEGGDLEFPADGEVNGEILREEVVVEKAVPEKASPKMVKPAAKSKTKRAAKTDASSSTPPVKRARTSKRGKK